jgi:hypothetical protein
MKDGRRVDPREENRPVKQFIANGTIKAGDIVYQAHHGEYVTTMSPMPSVAPIGVALEAARRESMVLVQMGGHLPGVVARQCASSYSTVIGGVKIMHCTRQEGHPGMHERGDFKWTDAQQAATDAAMAKEAEATLDRELGVLDAMLADVDRPSVGKMFIDGQEVADVTEVEMKFGDVKVPKPYGKPSAFKTKL